MSLPKLKNRKPWTEKDTKNLLDSQRRLKDGIKARKFDELVEALKAVLRLIHEDKI
jgi:hypothetical protein